MAPHGYRRRMKLADYIASKGMTRAAFADLAGIGRPYVTELCAGKSWPGREIAARIAEVTGGEVTANDFLEAPPERAAR